MKTMKKLLVALLAMMMVFSLAACGGDNGDNGDTGAIKDTFTYALGGEPNYLDPAVASDSVGSYVLNQSYYPLFAIGADGSTVKHACVDYSVDATRTVYTFKLTENNYWSDGQKVVAGDYVYGMLRSLGLGSGDSYYSYFIRNYVKGAAPYGADATTAYIADMKDVGIKALDDYTIEITLEKPCDYFVGLMTAGVFYPARKDYAKECDYTWAAELHPTNGPYTYEKIDNATEIVFVKNEYFYDAANIKTNKLIAKVMPDPDAQLMAFQQGGIDFASNVDSSVTKLYAGQPELVISDSVINYYMMMNAYKSIDALKDVRVRKAIQLGIDRSAIVTALDAADVYYELYGYVPKGFAGKDGDFRGEQDAANQLIKTDKEEAKRLMTEAGYSAENPLKLEYYYNQAAMHDTVAAVLKVQLADIYVDLTLRTGELRTFFDDRDQQGNFQLARGAMSADYMDPTTFLEMANSKNLYGNPTWGDAHYDQLLAEADLLTGAERIDKLHEAENYLVGEMAYTCPLFGYKQICLAAAGTTGMESSPQGNYTFWYVTTPAK